GTLAQESQLARFAEAPTGPALGVYQIEPNTHDDLYENFLTFPERQGLYGKVLGLLGSYPERRLQLVTNLAYATAIARLIYYRDPQPLPMAGDIDGLAKYYKRVFNT